MCGDCHVCGICVRFSFAITMLHLVSKVQPVRHLYSRASAKLFEVRNAGGNVCKWSIVKRLGVKCSLPFPQLGARVEHN